MIEHTVISHACQELSLLLSTLLRLIPSLSDTLFLPSFLLLWQSFPSPSIGQIEQVGQVGQVGQVEGRETLQNSFARMLTNPSFPLSLSLLPISVQVMLIELFPPTQSIRFPFPFSPLIHACSTFHFNESGIRLFEYAIDHGYPLSPLVMEQVVMMYSRLNVPSRSFWLMDQLSETQSQIMHCMRLENEQLASRNGLIA